MIGPRKLTKDEWNAAAQALDSAEARAAAWRNAARELRGERLSELDDRIADPELSAGKCDTIAEITEEGVAVLRTLLKALRPGA